MIKMSSFAIKCLLSLSLLTRVGYPRPPFPGRNLSQPDANQRVLALPLCSYKIPVGVKCRMDASPKQSPCDNALNACLSVVKAQDESIVNLKKDKQDLANRLADATKPPLLPTWAIILISGLTGFVISRTLNK